MQDSPQKLSRPIRTKDQLAKPLLQGREFLDLVQRGKSWSLCGTVLHRVVIKVLNFRTAGRSDFLIKPLARLVAQPTVLQHGLDERRNREDFTFLRIGQ